MSCTTISSRTLLGYALGTVAVIWLGGAVAVLPVAVLFFDEAWFIALVVIQWPLLTPLIKGVGIVGGLGAAVLVAVAYYRRVVRTRFARASHG